MSNKGKTQTARGRTPRFLVVLFAASMLTAAACGSSATEAESQVDGTIESETTTVATEPEEDASEPERSSDEPSAEDLLGTWNASFGPTWQIEADRIAVTGGSVTELTYVATDTTIEVSDDSGCEPGTYGWQIEEDVLTLSVVEDSCGGRRDNWNGATFDRAN